MARCNAPVAPSRKRLAFVEGNERNLYRSSRREIRSIPRGRMRGGEPRAVLAEQLLAQRSWPIGVLVPPPPHQFRHQHLGDVLEISGRNRKRDIEAIDPGLLEPGFDLVGHLLRRADHGRSDATDTDML